METLAGLAEETLDWIPPVEGNTISTLLYHLAAIELDYLYADVLQAPEPWPAVVMRLFPLDVRDAQGQLTPVRTMRLADHIERLDLVRLQLQETIRAMSLEEYRRPRDVVAHHITPEWVVHHLSQHEAEHRGHIALVRSWAEGTIPPQ